MRRTILTAVIAGLPVVGFADGASGTVNWYLNKAAWQADAGSHSAITFTELPANTWITEQYAHLGVHFTDNSDLIHHSNSFISDGAGLNGAFDESTLEFDAPMTAIAVDFPGLVAFRLFSNGQLIYESGDFGASGVGNFAGLISTQPFDSVYLHRLSTSGLFVDNLYFGPAIPTPGALTMLGMAALLKSRCTRRRTTPEGASDVHSAA